MRLNASEVRRAAIGCGVLRRRAGRGLRRRRAATRRSRATRIIAFGDETSVIVDLHGDGNGSKYSVNATVSEHRPTCDLASSNPIWVQIVANTSASSSRSATPGRPW